MTFRGLIALVLSVLFVRNRRTRSRTMQRVPRGTNRRCPSRTRPFRRRQQPSPHVSHGDAHDHERSGLSDRSRAVHRMGRQRDAPSLGASNLRLRNPNRANQRSDSQYWQDHGCGRSRGNFAAGDNGFRVKLDRRPDEQFGAGLHRLRRFGSFGYRFAREDPRFNRCIRRHYWRWRQQRPARSARQPVCARAGRRPPRTF